MGLKKEHDDFNIRDFKLAYIAEISLGYVKLYGNLCNREHVQRWPESNTV
jgi:hypothetical protein